MLIIENLTKTYPNGTHALNGVSLTIPTGQFVAIIGLSGSGKSTLLRCVNRLIEPTSGRIFLDDKEVTAADRRELRLIRRRIAMIFQHFNLVKRSSVLTNVLSGRLGYVASPLTLLGKFGSQDYADARESLARVGRRRRKLRGRMRFRADSSSASG